MAQNNDDPDIYYHRAQLHFILGEFADAAKDYQKSIDLDPNGPYAAQAKQGMEALQAMGVGIDTGTALLVDKRGIATLVRNNPHGSVLFLRGGAAQPISARRPLQYTGIQATLLDKPGQTFDFNIRCAHAPTYTIGVNGNATPIYNPENPYQPPRTAFVPSCHK